VHYYTCSSCDTDHSVLDWSLLGCATYWCGVAGEPTASGLKNHLLYPENGAVGSCNYSVSYSCSFSVVIPWLVTIDNNMRVFRHYALQDL